MSLTRYKRQFVARTLLLSLLGVLFYLAPANALPGFFAGKDAAPRKAPSTQVVVMRNGDDSVVSVMTEHAGATTPFALVLPVPSDVELADVKTLKRNSVERLEQLTAPRFHEFWEKDPCEPGGAEQIWERDLTAKGNTDFLGGAKMFAGGNKVPKEMRVRLATDFRDEGSEYKMHLVSDDVAGFLQGKGYQLPAEVKGKLGGYSGKFIVAEVDPNKVELGARGESLLSPIRYATKSTVELASTLGLAHVGTSQELLIYVLDRSRRYEVANYKNVYPPTNLHVDFSVKERIGEFYVALHDLMQSKQQDAFVVEFAWNTKDCGQPCTNASLKLHELLTLGADVFERSVPEEEKNPKPPERTEEQEAAYEAAEEDEQKRLDQLEKDVAMRKALIARQGDYVLTRLHHHYGKSGLTQDIKLRPAEHVSGGIDVPKGAGGKLPQGAKSGGEKSQFQARFVHLHPNKKVVKCDEPKPHRWGKPPITYRGANKIWVAERLAGKNRKQIEPGKVLLTSVPALGLAGKTVAAATKSEAEPVAKKSDCDCSVPGVPSKSPLWLLGVLAIAGLSRRKR